MTWKPKYVIHITEGTGEVLGIWPTKAFWFEGVEDVEDRLAHRLDFIHPSWTAAIRDGQISDAATVTISLADGDILHSWTVGTLRRFPAFGGIIQKASQKRTIFDEWIPSVCQ